jgi:hypothetical protein
MKLGYKNYGPFHIQSSCKKNSVHRVRATVGISVDTLFICSFCSGGNDEFADFSSAFSEGVTLSSNTIGSSSQHFNSGTVGSPTSVTSSNGNLGKKCLNPHYSVVTLCWLYVNI